MNAAYPTPVNPFAERESGDPERLSPEWLPNWKVDVGNGDTVGIAVDDGCFVVLYRQGTSWRPGKHIPKTVAQRMAELAVAGELD
jgi:hypothetical protein